MGGAPSAAGEKFNLSATEEEGKWRREEIQIGGGGRGGTLNASSSGTAAKDGGRDRGVRGGERRGCGRNLQLGANSEKGGVRERRGERDGGRGPFVPFPPPDVIREMRGAQRKRTICETAGEREGEREREREGGRENRTDWPPSAVHPIPLPHSNFRSFYPRRTLMRFRRCCSPRSPAERRPAA